MGHIQYHKYQVADRKMMVDDNVHIHRSKTPYANHNALPKHYSVAVVVAMKLPLQLQVNFFSKKNDVSLG
jgi:hypothetical protein